MVESIFFNPWVWILPIILAIAVAATVWGVWFRVKNGWEDGFAGTITVAISGIILVPLAGIYFSVVMPPYDAAFYQTYRITGEVTEIEAAISGDEGTMSQVFIAEVEGVDKYIRSNDQRFRTLTVGDDVNLVCSLEFRYFQEPWYDCAFGGAH